MQNIPTEGPKNVSLEMSNSHESKSIPDGRVTKVISHADSDTLNTEMLTL